VQIGVDSLKIEGRTKSAYYVARTCQTYRRAIDDALAGRPFDAHLVSELDSLANRGYTAGFYERHPDREHQNYLTGLSQMGASQYVGDLIAYRPDGLAEIEVKNRFAVGDRIELIHPAGNSQHVVERMEKVGADGTASAVTIAPGSGHRVLIPLPAEKQGAFLARLLDTPTPDTPEVQ
jgi:putative protease